MSLDYNGRSYADLPMEIILRILNFLSVEDCLEASVTCSQWFHALCHRKFMARIQLQFDKLQAPFSTFADSMRFYSNIRLNQVDLDDNSLYFWKRFGESFTHIEFNACDLRERTFIAILKSMVCLESLEIINCRELFMSGHLFKHSNDRIAVREACKMVKSLSLSNNRYISDALFNRIVEPMENIQSLNLSGCFISFHSALYRRFNCHHEASNNVFTFFVIRQFIESHAKTLKFLDFSETLIDGNALSLLAEIEELQLHGLRLRSCDQLTNNGISKLVSNQRSIQEIDLSLSVRFTDFSLLDICNTLSHLKVLKMRRCRAITDQGIEAIQQLKQLEILDLSECDAITSEGLIKSIASGMNNTMIELYVSALNLCEHAVIQLAESLKALRVLDLSFCKNAVTNLAVQIIFKNLTELRTLNLEFCDMISDAGITGLGMTLQVEQYEQSSIITAQEEPLNVFEESSVQNPYHISLRSKAELDIVNDSKRKILSLQICERLANEDQIDCSPYSMARLKGLRSLNLASCTRITDISLKRAFDFLELEILNLAKCQLITAAGLECLPLKCRSIKKLKLSDCHILCDHAIEFCIQLKRLKCLEIERCYRLTDASLDSIAKNCKNLKYLDVRGCRSMCAEPNLKFATLSSLQVLMSKPGPYMGSLQKQSIPIPPPPQSI